MTDNKIRCPWGEAWASCKNDDLLMRDYHDNEWGRHQCRTLPDRYYFEMLTLEGAQAGLSWAMILHKRENYRAAFDDWDIDKIAAYNEKKIAELLTNPGIIRNRLKIRSVVMNAQATLKLAGSPCYSSLSDFIWRYVDDKPIINQWTRMSDVPARTELSDHISKDMKKLGFKFVGSTIIYSYLQGIGVVNDHLVTCEFRGC